MHALVACAFLLRFKTYKGFNFNCRINKIGYMVISMRDDRMINDNYYVYKKEVN